MPSADTNSANPPPPHELMPYADTNSANPPTPHELTPYADTNSPSLVGLMGFGEIAYAPFVTATDNGAFGEIACAAFVTATDNGAFGEIAYAAFVTASGGEVSAELDEEKRRARPILSKNYKNTPHHSQSAYTPVPTIRPLLETFHIDKTRRVRYDGFDFHIDESFFERCYPI